MLNHYFGWFIRNDAAPMKLSEVTLLGEPILVPWQSRLRLKSTKHDNFSKKKWHLPLVYGS